MVPLLSTLLLWIVWPGSILLGTWLLLLIILPLVLAVLTCCRRRQQQHFYSNHYRSALYYGRVWHTRFKPVAHSFTYPLFLFGLDLHEEIEEQELFPHVLWPLSLIMNFRSEDHLKNQEGSSHTSTKKKKKNLSERLLTLVAERTQQRFQPTTETHRILLFTHLAYYGYCFNPVSFYYLQNKTTNKTDAVVGEVSNTPWNEMHCYVLHEASVDDVATSVLLGTDTQINYVFPKKFHVSPFMEMAYKYDWTFAEKLDSTVTIINEMRSLTDNQLCFRAKMQVERKSLHPVQLAFYVTTFPIYCFIIQLWIHYEAFQLFIKGVTFQPHPDGTETWASRAIGNAMRPLFALQEYYDAFLKKAKYE
ncbi:hypothetical protein FisN_19Lh238 [Fistulifera solaris]|uniref:DUF1365 domain-containing protein n=1 Tax=Fistulifera solaris TaxID=1519565 RepID=A0A1Z5K894_FISSO|nr:hypothetical protein FisN_19Lh238 [Fistulifera solaris]|eukprot:GAX22178.1 hypothetical protein FisN_19Lh238 [Fistulifera solaris]